MVFVRYTNPVNIKFFLFSGLIRLVFAEAGDAVAESLLVGLSSHANMLQRVLYLVSKHRI